MDEHFTVMICSHENRHHHSHKSGKSGQGMQEMSKRNTRSGIVLCALALVAAPLSTAHADAAKDVQVAGRALTFLENGPTGKAVLGVVFDPSKPASVAEKNAPRPSRASAASPLSMSPPASMSARPPRPRS
ncbi:hypothetical protein [Caulobacter sp. Root487D2Y]|uniref:hypothetical protein n=1 Tax=Caulobacter sp. Root487D2Y TaxID=1736547 RepID=UPI001F19FD5D|nr:hypothetical protein [Caulobacter sp. Root487D2Y]